MSIFSGLIASVLVFGASAGGADVTVSTDQLAVVDPVRGTVVVRKRTAAGRTAAATRYERSISKRRYRKTRSRISKRRKRSAKHRLKRSDCQQKMSQLWGWRYGAMAIGRDGCGVSWRARLKSVAITRALDACRRVTTNCKIRRKNW